MIKFEKQQIFFSLHGWAVYKVLLGSNVLKIAELKCHSEFIFEFEAELSYSDMARI